MAAWKEALLVIEWATKHQADNEIPNNVRIASKERTAVHKSMQRNTGNQMPNELKKRKAEHYVRNVDDKNKFKSKKRKVGHQKSNDVKIESKKRTAVVRSKEPNAENQMLSDVESPTHKRENKNSKSGNVESKTARIAEQIIYLKKSRVQHIYFKPQPGMNKIVLIASGQNEPCI